MVNITKLSPKDLYLYFLTEAGDSELFELVPLLPLALGDMGGVHKVLEKIQKGANLAAHYPADGDEAPKGELLGSIIDGSLYLING